MNYTEGTPVFSKTKNTPRYYIPSRDKPEEDIASAEIPLTSRRREISDYYRRNAAQSRKTGTPYRRSASRGRVTGAPYRRRITESKAEFRHPHFGERLKAQSTAALVIFLFIFAVAFIDSEITYSIKNIIKNEITKNITLDDVLSAASDLSNTVKTIFGFETDNPLYDEEIDKIRYDIEPNDTETHEAAQETHEPVEPGASAFRIDEEILEEIYSREDPYAKN